MIALNVTNVITIGIISLIVMAAARFTFKKLGVSSDWL